MAGWGESGELDPIRGYAETIDEIACANALQIGLLASPPLLSPAEQSRLDSRTDARRFFLLLSDRTSFELA